MGTRYDFVKTCMNEEQADYVINSVINEYSQDTSWVIGKASKEKLPNGEVKVVIELTKTEEVVEEPSQMRR